MKIPHDQAGTSEPKASISRSAIGKSVPLTADIMAASTKVAYAAHRLDRVKYTRGEASARKFLEARAAHLLKVMKRRGRVVV